MAGRAPRRPPPGRLAGLGLIAVVALTAAGTRAGPGRATGPLHPGAGLPPSPCGRLRRAPAYRHVVVVLMENAGYAAVANTSAAPFLVRLGRQCGLATDYRAVTHPSLPNYIALTAGTTYGITDDGEPSQHPLAIPSIFSELPGRWRALEESMPTPCDRVTGDSYAARHNPAVYYTDLGASCARDDVPLTYPLDLSAAYTFITPNICDDMHSCPVATGSAWLGRVVPLITASRLYREGRLAAFIVWDESDTGPDNRVAAYVIAPSVPAGLRVGLAFTHYSLLRTAEQLLGVPLLGAARRARSMVGPFHL